MRAALYLRRSIPRRDKATGKPLDEGDSLEVQEPRVLARIKAEGLELDQTLRFAEIGSGWNPKSKRPELLRLLRDVAAQKLRGVVLFVFSVSRLSRRGILDTLELVRQIKAGGGDLVSCTEPIDTRNSNPYSELTLSILSAIARIESDMRSQRQRAWAEYKRTKGERMGRKPVKIDVEQLEALLEVGTPIGRIARMIGVSRGTVKKAIRSLPRENRPELAG